ncbi:MAG: hypothetical protein N4J56_007373 [Chroococcidiopsis sp. SAG 2025]|uniref:hypothetical protein n=1 Tax=Chroococcidiopsis sp. SAG 2025 TaxID=171389 RepID=UPI002937292A|nr:hypothetical protein [Chroococcidiopsis sp. SAG 2025]MDV2997668.1 hypothetical protein [Chroococcidiopsis sp. SAG 2025]
MIRRCTNPNSDNWHRYGGRGIKVAERWKDFNNFLANMGERPSLKHKLDRINNDGDYEPGNCCWKTQKEQMRNTSVNRIIIAWGRSQTLTEWAEETGIKIATISKRLKCGWDSEKALSVPVRAKQRGINQ